MKCSSVVLFVVATFFSLFAQGASTLSYSGRLVNSNGTPVTGPVDLTFDLTYSSTTTTACTYSLNNVPLSNGVFHVNLDPVCLNSGTPVTFARVLSSIPSGESLVVRVTDTTPVPDKQYAYQAINTVPLAMMADTFSSHGATTDGQVLKWDNTNKRWIPGASGTGNGTLTSITAGTGLSGGTITTTGTISIAAGGVTDTEVSATANIAQSKISGLTTALSGKEPTVTAGTSAQYYRGDKTFVTLDSAAVPENTNLYFTFARVLATPLTNYAFQSAAPIVITDNIPQALAKLESQIASSNTSQGQYVLRDGSNSMTGNLDLNSHKIVGVTSPSNSDEAANKAYVDAQIAGVTASQWITTGSNVYYNSGNVGIGTNSPSKQLHIVNTAGSVNPVQIDIAGNGGIQLNRTGAGAGTATFQVTTNGDASIVADRNFGLTVNNSGTPNNSAFVVTSTGNVGMGTSSPLSTLDVKGTLRLSGSTSGYVGFSPAAVAGSTTYTLPVADGTSGYVLSTNGSGTLVWAAAGGPPSGTAGGDLSGTYPNPTIASVAATKVGGGTVDDTEFSYLDGVTSAIQTQFTGKQSTILTGYTVGANAAVDATDTVLAGFGKTQGQINALVTANTGKEPAITAGTTSQYYRGDKTFVTLDTSVVPENTNLYFTQARTLSTLLTGYTTQTAIPLATTDTILDALGKLEADFASVSSSGQWSTSSGNVYRTSGNVGIGTSAPTLPLEVNGGSGTGLLVTSEGSGDVAQIAKYSDTSGASLRLQSSRGTASAQTSKLDGDVIGELVFAGRDSSGYKNLASVSAYADGEWNTAGDTSDNPSRLEFKTTLDGTGSRATRMTISSAGNVGIGTSAPLSSHVLTVDSGSNNNIYLNRNGNPNILFAQNSTAIGQLRADSASGVIGFANSGGTFLLAAQTSNGNVGIGTSAPGSALDVKGTLRLSGSTSGYVGFSPAAVAGSTTYTLPATDGTTGYVLSTNGSGTLVWAAAGGPPSGAAGGDLSGTYPNPTITGLAATKVGGGAVDNTEFSYLDGVTSAIQTQFTGKEPTITAGTTAQYYRGDKTFVTLDTSVVPENTNLYFTQARTLSTLLTGYTTQTAIPLATTDTVLQALGKLEADFASVSSNGQWTTSSGNVYRTSGNVGIGTSAPTAPLHTIGTSFPVGIFQLNASGTGGVASSFRLFRNNTTPLAGDGTGFVFSLLNDTAATINYARISSIATSITTGSEQGALAFEVGNANVLTEKMRIKSDGSVGIGTSSPSDRLHVSGGDARFEQNIILTGRGQLRGGTNATDVRLSATGNLELSPGGFVGIGTTAPQSLLHTSSTSNILRLDDSDGVAGGSISSMIDFYAGSTHHGRVGFSSSSGNMQVINHQGHMQFLTGASGTGTERLRINSGGGIAVGTYAASTSPPVDGMIISGNVGVGTTAPGSALDVKGTLRLSGSTSGYVGLAPAATAGSTTYTLPAADGTSGYVLSTNGSGVLSWAAAGGVPSGSAGGDLSGTYPNPTITALAATKVGGGAVDDTEFSYLDGVTSAIQTQFTGKEPTITAGTTAQYYRGDKTFVTLDTSVVPENTNLYFTYPRVLSTVLTGYAVGTALPISGTDTVLQALGKLEADFTSVSSNGQWTTSSGNVYRTSGSVGIGTSSPVSTLDVRGNTNVGTTASGAYIAQNSPDGFRDAIRINRGSGSYTMGMSGSGLDLQFGAGATLSDLNTKVTFTQGGNVGIGTLSPGAPLDVKGAIRLSGSTSGYVGFAPAAVAGSTVYTLPAADGTSGYVLSTNGSGTLSWAVAGGAPTGAAGGDLSGTYPNPTITGLAATKVGGGAVDDTEFSYLDGVTSAIQTQFTGKQSTVLTGYVVGANTAVDAADTVLAGFGKVQGQINALVTADTGKEPTITAGTTAQYYRGDKTFVTLDTSVVPENTNLYFTNARGIASTLTGFASGAGAITAADTILSAIQKLNGNIAAGTGPTGAAGGDLSGTYPNPTITALAATKVGAGAVDNTEFSYLDGVTSAIQTQFTGKQSTVLTGYVVGANTALDAADTVLAGFGKVQGQINALTTGNSGKEPAITAGTTAQYYRGDKTFVTLDTSVVPENTNLYFTYPRVLATVLTGYAVGTALPISATDTVLQAIGKLEADYASISSNGQWTTSAGNIYRATGNIGVGTTNTTSTITLGGTSSQKIGMEKNSTANSAGSGLTIESGGATSGATDKAGGLLNLSGGISTGTGTSSISFSTASAGSTGTANNSPTTKMTIDGAGNVGVGTTNPSGAIHVVGTNSLFFDRYGASQIITQRRANGTVGSATALAAGDEMGRNSFTGHQGSGFGAGGSSIRAYTEEAFDTTHNGSNLRFYTTPNATVAQAEVMRMNNAGNVLIGQTTSAGYKLEVNGDVNIASASVLRFGGTSVCTNLGCTSSSDRSLKENIKPLQGSLEKLLKLQGVEYNYKDKVKYSGKHQVGVIAQDVEKFFPEVVQTDSKSGLKSVAYDHLVAPIIEAVKELYNRVNADKIETMARLKKLETENALLRVRLEKLEKSL